MYLYISSRTGHAMWLKICFSYGSSVSWSTLRERLIQSSLLILQRRELRPKQRLYSLAKVSLRSLSPGLVSLQMVNGSRLVTILSPGEGITSSMGRHSLGEGSRREMSIGPDNKYFRFHVPYYLLCKTTQLCL